MTKEPSVQEIARRLKKAYPDGDDYAVRARGLLNGCVEEELDRVSWIDEFHYVTDYGDGPQDEFSRVGVSPAGFYFVSRSGYDLDDVEQLTYWSEEDARKAAENVADSQNIAEEGEDADDVIRRRLEERAGEPDSEGLWACYWHTVSDDAGPSERYATFEQAEAMVALKQGKLDARNPGGGLLCGFEVRYLEDGEWVRNAER